MASILAIVNFLRSGAMFFRFHRDHRAFALYSTALRQFARPVILRIEHYMTGWLSILFFSDIQWSFNGLCIISGWWFQTFYIFIYFPYFSIIYGIIFPIDTYFSRWLKPPTRLLDADETRVSWNWQHYALMTSCNHTQWFSLSAEWLIHPLK